MKILNFGSLNIDLVYHVDHIAKPGETIASSAHEVFAGGKGANQSAALALAGADVAHAGQVGPEGQWLVDKLVDIGVDMRHTSIGDVPTGHAIIQVDKTGQNSIVLFPGANQHIKRQIIDTTLSQFNEGGILLLQNEINDISHIIQQASKYGLKICFNPAPYGPEVLQYPLGLIDLLIVNETEANGLVGLHPPEQLIDRIATTWPKAQIILTMGEQGAYFCSAHERFHQPATPCSVVDTTGAGDTFLGYFLQGIIADMTPRTAMARASAAAALCIAKPGAMDSIPSASNLS
jgi:ribokinase